MKKIILGGAAVLGAAAFGISAVGAATTTQQMDVSATITNVCLLKVDPMAFGAVGNQQSPTQTSKIFVSCSDISTTSLTVDDGLNPGGASSVRQMSDGSGNFVGYHLYDGVGVTDLIDGATVDLLSNDQKEWTGAVLGKIVPADYIPGTYSDTVTFTLSYTAP